MAPRQRQLNTSTPIAQPKNVVCIKSATSATVVSSNKNGNEIDENVAEGLTRSISAGSAINTSMNPKLSMNSNANVKRKGRFNIVHPDLSRSRSGSASNTVLFNQTSAGTVLTLNSALLKATNVSEDMSSMSGPGKTPAAPGSPDSSSGHSHNSAGMTIPSSFPLANENVPLNTISVVAPVPLPLVDESKTNQSKSAPPSSVKAKKKSRFLLTSTKGTAEQSSVNNSQSSQNLKSMQQRQQQVIISPVQSLEDAEVVISDNMPQSKALSHRKDNHMSSSLTSLTKSTNALTSSATNSCHNHAESSMILNSDFHGSGLARMGILFQLCDQMKNEIVDTDKTILHLQHELSLLRTKNKELETANIEIERRYMEERNLRMRAELQLERLRHQKESNHFSIIPNHENLVEPVPSILNTPQKESQHKSKKVFHTSDSSLNNLVQDYPQQSQSLVNNAMKIQNDRHDLETQERLRNHNTATNTNTNTSLHSHVTQQPIFMSPSINPAPIPSPPKVSSALHRQLSSPSKIAFSASLSSNGSMDKAYQQPPNIQYQSKRQGHVPIPLTTQESKKFYVKDISNIKKNNGKHAVRNDTKSKNREFKTRNTTPTSNNS